MSDILSHIVFHPSIDVEEPSLMVCTSGFVTWRPPSFSLASPLFPNM